MNGIFEENVWVEPTEEVCKKLLAYSGQRMGKERPNFFLYTIIVLFMLVPCTLGIAMPDSWENSGFRLCVIFFLLFGTAVLATLIYDRDTLEAVQICKTTALGKDYYCSRGTSGYRIIVPLEAMPEDRRRTAELDEEYGNMKHHWRCSCVSYRKISAGDTVVLVRLFWRKGTHEEEVYPMSYLTGLKKGL